jgi:hypothetical protein
MAGLLDGILGSSIDDPRTAATLALAQGLLTSPKAMQGLSGGLLGYQNAMAEAKKAKQMEEMRQMQVQQQQMAMEQARQAQAKQTAIEQAYRGALRTPDQMAMAKHGGPTVAAAGAAQGMAPGLDQNALIQGLIGADPMAAAQMLQPKAAEYMTVGDVVLQKGPSGLKEAYRAPAKPEAAPSAVREYEYAKGQGYQGSFQQFQLEQRRAGATNVRVDSGPKAFDTELGKLAVESFGKEREGASAAASTIQSVAAIRQAAQGGAYQGAGADLKLGAAKALGAIGMPYDARTVANSELFSAQANQFVLNSIKGLGANPSNADREFIEKTVPRLQTDPAALPQLLSFIENKARSQLTKYNEKARSVKAGASYLPFSLEVSEPDVGGGWSIKPIGGK